MRQLLHKIHQTVTCTLLSGGALRLYIVLYTVFMYQQELLVSVFKQLINVGR